MAFEEVVFAAMRSNYHHGRLLPWRGCLCLLLGVGGWV